MPNPLTIDELRLIADALRSHGRIMTKLAEHELLPDEADAVVPAVMEKLASRVEEQTAQGKFFE